jgi:hypothetical protein
MREECSHICTCIYTYTHTHTHGPDNLISLLSIDDKGIMLCEVAIRRLCACGETRVGRRGHVPLATVGVLDGVGEDLETDDVATLGALYVCMYACMYVCMYV